ncbi:MAG: DUF2182 domain-containing protein, partial [Thermohalobaculum sp.]|nr:DUF2182 domain-containing protein [Thermohalobaculum sp.]
MTAWRLSERPRAMAGLGVGLAAGAAWLGLAALGHGTAGHGEAGLGIAGGAAPGSGFGSRLAELCLAVGAPGVGAYPAVAAIWLLMSVAMMLPTAAPAIDLYARLSRRIERGRLACLAGFAGGYVLAWGGFGLVAAAV